MSLLKLFSREHAHIHSEVSLLFSHDGTVQEIKVFSALTKFNQSALSTTKEDSDETSALGVADPIHSRVRLDGIARGDESLQSTAGRQDDRAGVAGRPALSRHDVGRTIRRDGGARHDEAT